MNRNEDAASTLKQLRNFLLVPASILCLALLLWFALRHGLRTGFKAERIQLGEHEHYVPAKTLWDWLQLFGAPVALAVIAYLFQRRAQVGGRGYGHFASGFLVLRFCLGRIQNHAGRQSRAKNST